MEPTAVEVVLRTGDVHTFSQGRRWEHNHVAGTVAIADGEGATIAIIADGGWYAVGYSYPQPCIQNPVPPPTPAPAPCPMWTRIRTILTRPA